MALSQLFELLAPLPIEFLSLTACFEHLSFHELLCSIPLLQRSLLVIMADIGLRHTWDLRQKADYVRVEHAGNCALWPPPYRQLSPEAQAIFRYRPYRASSSPPLPFSVIRGTNLFRVALSINVRSTSTLSPRLSVVAFIVAPLSKTFLYLFLSLLVCVL
jgi:hypothetical protein